MFKVRTEIDRTPYLIEAKADRLAEAKSILAEKRGHNVYLYISHGLDSAITCKNCKLMCEYFILFFLRGRQSPMK